uniref:GIY-YIG homing endonuclease n=1 Tax=Romanomermis culicivorax TaxID=13658 RepID=A0A915L6S1_ROMCU
MKIHRNLNSNIQTYNDERRKHAELYQNYTADYGYLKGQLVVYCIMSKKGKNEMTRRKMKESRDKG